MSAGVVRPQTLQTVPAAGARQAEQRQLQEQQNTIVVLRESLASCRAELDQAETRIASMTETLQKQQAEHRRQLVTAQAGHQAALDAVLAEQALLQQQRTEHCEQQRTEQQQKVTKRLEHCEQQKIIKQARQQSIQQLLHPVGHSNIQWVRKGRTGKLLAPAAAAAANFDEADVEDEIEDDGDSNYSFVRTTFDHTRYVALERANR